MEGGQYNPRTVEDVFRDFQGRRLGLIKALTTDDEEFYHQCDPKKENLCLYGFPNEHWEVNFPAEEVPPKLPEPALGVNFARDGMQEKDWLSFVAVHSDAWLLAVAYYFGARFGFDEGERKRLFIMINELPAIFEVVTGTAKKQNKEKSSVSNHSTNKRSNSKGRASEAAKDTKALRQRKRRAWKKRRRKKKTRSTEIHCVELAGRTTLWKSSGSAATCARSGSMVNG